MGCLCSVGSKRRQVPRRHRSYSALRLPDHHRPRLRFPSLSAYLLGGCLFLSGIRRHPLPRSRWRLVTGSPSHRIYFLRGMIRISQLTGPSSSCAPRSYTPPDVPSPRPFTARGTTAFELRETLDIRYDPISRLHSRGSHARVPTHQPSGYPKNCKAHYRPAGLLLWSGGFRTHWTTHRFSLRLRHLLFHRTSIYWSLPRTRATSALWGKKFEKKAVFPPTRRGSP